jgi:hypothetical protein
VSSVRKKGKATEVILPIKNPISTAWRGRLSYHITKVVKMHLIHNTVLNIFSTVKCQLNIPITNLISQ